MQVSLMRSLSHPRSLAVAAALAFGLALSVASLLSRAPLARAISTDLVISQVYGGGGATTAATPFCNDAIELFNTGASAVSLAGKSVQYGAATSNYSGIFSLRRPPAWPPAATS